MTWILNCIIIAFIIYFSYNVLALYNFGVPYSLSKTYYLFEEKKKSRISGLAPKLPSMVPISVAQHMC